MRVRGWIKIKRCAAYLPPKELRLVVAVEERDCLAQPRGCARGDGLLRLQKEQRKGDELADRVEQDGERRHADGLRVLLRAAHDADVGAEVADAALELVAGEGLEGLAGEQRVHEEEELQRERRGLRQHLLAACRLALSLQPEEGAEHDQADDDEGEHDPEEELGRVARDVEALEWGRLEAQIDAESADDGDAAVNLLDIVGHGDIVHVVHLRRRSSDVRRGDGMQSVKGGKG